MLQHLADEADRADAENDPGRAVAKVPIEFGASSLDRDSSLGAGAVELALTKLLGGS
ncbi:MAG: hypothetical protein ACXVRK_14140 [Gaiellaceae bacterium]